MATSPGAEDSIQASRRGLSKHLPRLEAIVTLIVEPRSNPRPQNPAPPITRWRFTRDAAMRHQYYGLYEAQFRAASSAHAFRYVEDEHDRHGDVLLLVDRGRCVGGVRLNVRGPGRNRVLPIEHSGFSLARCFPHLEGEIYGQVTHLCLMPDYRGQDNLRAMFRILARRAHALGAVELFGTATRSYARLYRASCAALGYGRTRIHRGLALPAYPMCEGLEFELVQIPVDIDPPSCRLFEEIRK